MRQEIQVWQKRCTQAPSLLSDLTNYSGRLVTTKLQSSLTEFERIGTHAEVEVRLQR